jgi:hypothetical protein
MFTTAMIHLFSDLDQHTEDEQLSDYPGCLFQGILAAILMPKGYPGADRS